MPGAYISVVVGGWCLSYLDFVNCMFEIMPPVFLLTYLIVFFFCMLLHRGILLVCVSCTKTCCRLLQLNFSNFKQIWNHMMLFAPGRRDRVTFLGMVRMMRWKGCLLIWFKVEKLSWNIWKNLTLNYISIFYIAWTKEKG